jgi:hypothetical protein
LPFLGQARVRISFIIKKEEVFMAKAAGGDVLDKECAEKVLYSGAGLPGGGQLEIRMEISADHPDPDIRGVARAVKFFN